MKGFSGLCAASGHRVPIRQDGTIGRHPGTPKSDGSCVSEGERPIPGTEVCRECRGRRPENETRTRVGPVRHKVQCSQRGEQPR